VSSNSLNVAIVDIYDFSGQFVNRVDFRGPGSVSNAKQFAEVTGTVLCSGTTVMLGNLESTSFQVGNRLSTFIPDGLDLNGYSLMQNDDISMLGGAHRLKTFIVRVPKSPRRSPLHREAVTFDDLDFGLKLKRYHCNQPMQGTFVIAGKPYTDSDGDWWIKVLEQGYRHEPILEDRSLADIGIVPYKHRGRWSLE
jgi:hypothetical protein